jgi:DnaJ-class molecular chaperone
MPRRATHHVRRPVRAMRDCTACGGEGWLPSRPEGQSECPYCEGTGRIEAARRRTTVGDDR